MIKTQSLSAKRSSPSKGDEYTKNHMRRLNRTRAINTRLSQVTFDLQNFGEEKDAKLNCAQDWDTRLHLLLPETQSSNLILKCQRERFRLGLSAERRGLNTDHLSFILKPCHLTELLGFLFPTRQI